MLSIIHCPKLEGSLPEKLDLLAKLGISGCEELVVSISNYYQLHESDISNCKLVMHTSPVHYELLESLRFSNISEFKITATEAFMKSLEKVKDLKITGCEELTSSFQNEDRLLQHMISLGRLDIDDNCALVEKLGKEAEQLLQLGILDCKLESLRLNNCASLLKVPEGLHHHTSLQELYISECSSLVSFPDVGLPSSLKTIHIRKCDSLLYFARYQIPPSLRRIVIWECENLKSLIEKEEQVVDGCCLESLEIWNCPSLLSLLCKGQLPRALKELRIENCRQLELITDRFLDGTCLLELIQISDCPNLKSLPEGLCHLTNLQSFVIYSCQSLVLLLPTMSVRLREMNISNCEKLEIDIQNLNSLEELTIDDCEGLTSFPPNLTSLKIWKMKNCKALLESQGLHRLTSLRELSIWGEDDRGLVSFPAAEKENKNEMMLQGLSKSLIHLTIDGFPNLKKLSNGFQFLTSLEILKFWYCPKLASILEEGLPLSLGRLAIRKCPLLEERCKGRYRPKIAHIPCVEIDWKPI